MEEYACQRKDLDFVSLLGSMEEGAALAKEYYSDFDIIISRANTADLIKKAFPSQSSTLVLATMIFCVA